MDLVARDAIGTSHSNAAVATGRMAEWLVSSIPPREFELDAIVNLLTNALLDAVFARHMLSESWNEATYHGVWDNEY